MPRDEIEVPKELREFMLEEAEETVLGEKNGAKKQYRVITSYSIHYTKLYELKLYCLLSVNLNV